MESWMHCNACHTCFSNSTSFVVTTCGHVYCSNCKKQAVNCCFVCGKKCQITPVNQELNSKTKTFFMPIDQLRRKEIEMMKLHSEVVEFQSDHRARLFKYMQDKITRQNKMLQVAENAFTAQREENRRLKEDLRILKKYITSFKAHTSGRLSNKPSTPMQLQSISIAMHDSPRPTDLRNRNTGDLCSTPLNRSQSSIQRAASSRYFASSPSQAQSPYAMNRSFSHTSPMMESRPPTPQTGFYTPTAKRLSMCSRPVDGKIGTPSPRALNTPIQKLPSISATKHYRTLFPPR